jgi:hypothetical protein
MKSENIQTIKDSAPLAWADFKEFCSQQYATFFSLHTSIDIETIPFAMLIGVFQAYFIEHGGAELDLGNLSYEQLETEVVDAFIVQEGIRRHYS